MKFATAPIRPLICLGVGLAVGAAAFLGAPVAASAAEPEGAYWHTRTLSTSTHPWKFGTRTNSYSLVQQRITERWTTPDGKSWFGYRELGTLPKSAADKKAWQRDGSPAKWSSSIDGKTVKLSTQPAKGDLTPIRNPNEFQLGGQRLTYDEVQRLPADPNGLKTWLTKAAQAGRVPAPSIDRWITGTLQNLLYTIPAPKEVRAAAYNALLTMPGVRSQGNATDSLGRSGAAVLVESTTKQKKHTTTVKIKLTVDTGRMVLLSEDQTVWLNGKRLEGKSPSQTIVEAGWTDSEPVVPALP
ncbi:hypothetical protein ABZ897_23870 [Nonomuraea sp. NPDC046802]|uniref:hypothetical protein n=1 Tax=Nonomuraea sp. NPDC046802 TaxID=3154919 RepID=UPI0033EEA2F1